MKVSCNKCKATYTIDASRLPDSEIQIPCKKCGQPIKLKKGDPAHESTQETLNSEESKKSSRVAYKDSLFSKLISGIDIQSLNKRKLSVCAGLFLILLAIQMNPIRNMLFENHLFHAIDSGAEAVIDENMKRATVSFAVARSINGVISIIQESHLSIQPAGLGISMAAGQFLDPVNDLIERFSWIMLLSLISLGVMKVLIHVSSWLSVDIFLSFGLLFILLGMFLTENKREILFAIAKKALIGAIIIRFAVPVVAHLNQKVYYSVLESEYTAATAELEHTNKELSKLNQEMEESPTSEESSGWMSKFSDVKNSVAEIADLRTKIAAIKQKVGNMAETLVRLSVVFILNTVLLPIGFLWLFMKITRMLFGSQFAFDLEQRFRAKIFRTNKAESTATAAA